MEETGLTRAQWIEALEAHDSSSRRHRRTRTRYTPDPRATLFHVT